MEQELFELIDGLDADERSILKTALSRQIGDFFDSNNELNLYNDSQRKRFNLVATALRKLLPIAQSVPPNGIAYYGRPDWLKDDLLNLLITEAQHRRFEPLDKIDHFLGCGGFYADQMAASEDLHTFMREKISPVTKTGIASYIYYDTAGSGIKPHVDTDVFALNMIIMLKHQCPADQTPSATVIFPAHSFPEYYRLKVGEVLVMYGSSTIHTRSIVQQEETVHILTIGFNPIQTETA